MVKLTCDCPRLETLWNSSPRPLPATGQLPLFGGMYTLEQKGSDLPLFSGQSLK